MSADLVERRCYICDRKYLEGFRRDVPVCMACRKSHLSRPTPPAPRITAPGMAPIPFAGPKCIGYSTCMQQAHEEDCCKVHGCTGTACYCAHGGRP